MRKPLVVTFTGVDEHTEVRDLVRLAIEFKDLSIEWGLLFSPDRQGAGRYPPLKFITDLTANRALRFAAHVCGGYSASVLSYCATSVDDVIDSHFQRVQINTTQPYPNLQNAKRWAERLGAIPILQCRGPYPLDPTVRWLFDASGGRGIEPKGWPEQPEAHHRMVGYAGGLNPGNVLHHVQKINLVASSYWIDMETGVRDTRDRFDVDACASVCKALLS